MVTREGTTVSDERSAAKLLGLNMRARRQARGLSLRQMTEALDMRPVMQKATLQKIELGERSPTIEQAHALAKFFEYELTPLHLTMPELYPAPAFRQVSEAA